MVTRQYLVAMAMLALLIVSAVNVVIGGIGLLLIGAGVTALGLVDAGTFFVAWTVILLLVGWWFLEAA